MISADIGRALTFSACVLCFTSFGWAMQRHFLKSGPRSTRLRITGLTGIAFACLYVAALLARPLLFPQVGFGLFILSAALFWSAIYATRGKGFAACFQGHVTPELVRTGPYRVIRHPFYVSYELAWMAGFLATGWWPLAIVASAQALLYYTAACEEERGFNCSALAEEYLRYRETTGKFLPKLSRSKIQSRAFGD